MKRILLILLAVLMLSITACTTPTASPSPTAEATEAPTAEPTAEATAEPTAEPEDEPAAAALAEKAGYKIYTDAQETISFYFPEDWMELSPSILESEDITSMIESTLGMKPEDFLAQLESVDALMLDMANSDVGFSANTNLVITPQTGQNAQIVANEASMKAYSSALEKQLGNMLPEFGWVEELAPITIGDVEGITYTYSCIINDVKVIGKQALVDSEDHIYVFTFSYTEDTYTDDVKGIIDALIDSIIFLG